MPARQVWTTACGGPAERGRPASAIVGAMAWTWQFEKADGTLAGSRTLPKETFGSQGDAETWLGEQWRNLLDAGVDQVSLLEDGRCEYGPMNLHPAEG